jgi:DNA-binding NarL/FixJ family response regulator
VSGVAQGSPGVAQGSPGGTQDSPGVIRVLLADDHPVVREGLRGMLAAEPDLEVAAEAGSGREAVTRALATGPDVILMDLRMPDGDGVAAIASLRDSGCAARIIVLTTYDTDSDIIRAVEAGASGYLLKDTPRADLVAAIRAAARGETVLAPVVAGALVTRVRDQGAGRGGGLAPGEALSARETEVLALVARGLTNVQIGRTLFVSEATVKTHLTRACGKLGVVGRTAAVTKAMEIGALPSPGGQPGRAG